MDKKLYLYDLRLAKKRCLDALSLSQNLAEVAPGAAPRNGVKWARYL